MYLGVSFRDPLGAIFWNVNRGSADFPKANPTAALIGGEEKREHSAAVDLVGSCLLEMCGRKQRFSAVCNSRLAFSARFAHSRGKQVSR
jgi:hypothetical protein